VVDGAFPAWTVAIGGQYVKEEMFPFSDKTNSAGQTQREFGIMKRSCVACPKGKRNPNALSLDTTTAGQLGEQTCTETLTCPAHSYLSSSGACAKCASRSIHSGTTSSLEENWGASACQSTCGDNEYLATVGGNRVCEKCVLGTVRGSRDSIFKSGATHTGGTGSGIDNDVVNPVTKCVHVYCPDNTARDTKGNCCKCPPGEERNQERMIADQAGVGDEASYLDVQKASILNAAQTCLSIVCEKDHFATGSPTFQCQPCADGKTRPKGDSANEEVGTVCNAQSCGKIGDIYHKKQGMNCIACQPWQTAPIDRQLTDGVDTECTALMCAVDEYVSKADDHACEACDAWTTSVAMSRNAPTACTVRMCAVNQFVDKDHAEKVCRDCPMGTSVAVALARTDTQGPAACVHSTRGVDLHPSAKCLENHHVVEHKCTPCKGGDGVGQWTRDAGDDPFAVAYTECSPPAAPLRIKHKGCAIHEHVHDHTCRTCPVGTTNAAGDDPHYHDTACTAVLCNENERVVCADPLNKWNSCVCRACNLDAASQGHGGDTEGTLEHRAGDVGVDDGSNAGATNANLHLTNTAGDDCSKKLTTYCV